MKPAILISILAIASVAFGAAPTKDQSLPKTFFPSGRHSCEVYGGMMTRVGSGAVEIRNDQDGSITLIVEFDKKRFPVRFLPDRANCVFLERVQLSSEADFGPDSGGVLGNRISRSWSSDRYTVMIGYTFKDQSHVVYLRDRLTNDPLLVAKFPAADESR